MTKLLYYKRSIKEDTKQASRDDIFMTRKNTLQYGLRSVRFAGAKSWNSISDDIKKSPSAFIFVVNSNLVYSLQNTRSKHL